MRRGGALVCLVLCTGTLVTIAPARAESPTKTVVIVGRGAAHGLGMAMDGVEGQARAGWPHDRILDLFYPGSAPGRASGTIRVGLGDGTSQRFALPGGGRLTGPVGARTLPPETSVTVSLDKGRPVLSVQGAPAAASPSPAPAEARGPVIPAAEPANPLESPQPPPILTPLPTSTPEPRRTPPPAPDEAAAPAGGSVWIVPAGEPAVTRVEATGRRYRGSIEVRPVAGTLRVVNHVDLETYTAGIAEEKGAGWPLEGLKVLAVAARTLGAATMTWYAKNQANGYDICPTQNCQVYLGYDGEEPLMRRAVAETSGIVRVYDGTPILAMYHGNGGGLTESYRRVARTTSDPHPYLRSVRYPYADPKEWRREETFASIGAALAARGVAVPGPIDRIQILERGDSPRVIQLRVHGNGQHRDMTGTTFAQALDLWSTWFDIGDSERFPPSGPDGAPASRLGGREWSGGTARGSPWVLVTTVAALAGLAGAAALRARGWRLPRRLRLGSLRPGAAPGPSPRTP